MATNIYTVIMAGGIGSRFWPQSRQNLPKQFVDILGIGKSLLQLTWERSLKFSPKENILILTNEAYKNLVTEQLPDVLEDNILLEPSRNNTAPCLAYAAFKLYKKNEHAVMMVLPSDHLIAKEDAYFEKMQTAISFVQRHDALLTLGIQPVRPDTGYGYIQFSKSDEAVKNVLCFKEKPDEERAKAYIASGDYLWNAGIFIWKVRDLLNALEKFSPELYALFLKGKENYNTEKEQKFIRENYPKSPNISIDYAIMEKAKNVYTLPADIGWSDLGTWASLWSVKKKDENNNVLLAKEESLLSDTKNSMISAHKKKLLVIDGLSDYIVVDKEDVLLIYPKNKEQDIKKVIAKLQEQNVNEYL